LYAEMQKRKLLNTEQTRLIHVFMRLFYCSWWPTHQ